MILRIQRLHIKYRRIGFEDIVQYRDSNLTILPDTSDSMRQHRRRYGIEDSGNVFNIRYEIHERLRTDYFQLVLVVVYFHHELKSFCVV